jgi:hypothetical protein
MRDAARKLVASFESLPETDKHEVLAELLSRTLKSNYSSPSNDELLAAADEIFLELDRREIVE